MGRGETSLCTSPTGRHVCSGGGRECLLRGTLFHVRSFLGAWENPPYRTVTCPCGFSPGGLVLGGIQLPDSATPCQLWKYQDLSVLRDKQPRPPNALLSEYSQPSNAKVNGRWGRGGFRTLLHPAGFLSDWSVGMTGWPPRAFYQKY